MAERKFKLSPTKISAFLSCAIYYRYEYLDRIGKFYHKPQPGFAFGSTLHRTLQSFHQAPEPRALTSAWLHDKAKELWQSVGYVSKEDEERYRVLAVEILTRYHQTWLADTRASETFATEKQISVDMGSFILSGRVDRIILHPDHNELEIVDYKSGRSTVTIEDVRNALAMSIYQLLVTKVWPGYKVSATIHALSGNVTATSSLTTDELNELEVSIRDVARQILETDFNAKRPEYKSDICDDCDFRQRCLPYFKADDLS